MLNCGAAAPVTVSVSFSRVPHLPQPQISSASLSSHHPSNPGGGGDPEEAKLTLPRYKWRLLIAYDGTQYSGWQYQQSPPTIQCIVESALTRATKLGRKDLSLVGASRTDAGVHAWGQVAHFVTPFNYDSLNSIHAALNGLLPSDIRVREISPAIPEFHARYSAKTAKHFVGKHDFSAFVNTTRNDRLRDPVKNIFHFEVIELGALLQLEVEGSGFLYRQVRNMVALLLQIGREAIPPDIVPKILATRDRKELAKYALSVPPQGLCLTAVKYREEHLQLPTGCPTTSFGRHHSISKCKLPFYWDS
ncbi:uncharacterized protein LOC131151659 isoform X7 [Malania oleifera]|uniref:uncharacterized protein LOC131151659 isoform X7 n=1 Tax=Malania oleifera TaxID=397392 RepID=UPI0025AEC101|nr:uncharacterized protein LOC131151659 isoform X7 [Malania oleifera]